jgi:hypothetical protein
MRQAAEHLTAWLMAADYVTVRRKADRIRNPRG